MGGIKGWRGWGRGGGKRIRKKITKTTQNASKLVEFVIFGPNKA